MKSPIRTRCQLIISQRRQCFGRLTIDKKQSSGHYLSFLKKESTNSSPLNNCKSSISSPTSMYFTGIWNWSEIPITTPPFAVPSSFVTASAFTSVAAVNCFAYSKAFCPVEPSKTKSTSCGASGTIFCITRLILESFKCTTVRFV